MGFLKKAIPYFFLLLLFNSCVPSVIKIDLYKDANPYSQYGKTSQREFVYNGNINLNLKEVWETEINGGFSNSSATIYDSLIFINDLSGRIYCFSVTSGKPLGKLKYKGSIYTTPVIHRYLIIFCVTGDKENLTKICYYDFREGKEISITEIQGRVTSQLLKIDDGIIILTEIGLLYKFDFTGNKIWQYDSKNYSHSSPASNGKMIVFGNDGGEIVAINSAAGQLIYRKKIGKPFFCGAVIHNEKILIGNEDGNIYSLDLPSGLVKWSFQTGARILMEPVHHNDEIYIGNLKGEFFKLSSNGEQIWKAETKGLLNITPLITENCIILPDENKKIYFVSRDNGIIKQVLEFDGRAKLNPVIRNNLLFVGYENGMLKAYEISQQ